MAEATKNNPAKADPRHDPDKPSASLNAMDRTEANKAAAEQAKANKEAAERSAIETPPPPTPTQEEADAMKETALGEIPPGGTLPASTREAKAAAGSGKADYQTR